VFRKLLHEGAQNWPAWKDRKQERKDNRDLRTADLEKKNRIPDLLNRKQKPSPSENNVCIFLKKEDGRSKTLAFEKDRR
jgi:hypothetical protein